MIEGTQSKPKVSVIIPVYRALPYIDQCLKSIQEQTFSEFEVLCVDDLGGDGTIAVAEEYAAKDARFHVLRHEKNSGAGAARNTGIRNAVSEYLVFVDSDDWLERELLQKLYDAMIAGGADSVVARYVEYDEKSGATKRLDGIPTGVVHVPEKATSIPVTPWAKIYRRDDLLANSIFFPEKVCEDTGFFFNFHALFPKLHILDYDGYYYRHRQDSIMGDVIGGRGRPEDFVDMMEESYWFLQSKNCFEANINFFLDYYFMTTIPYLFWGEYKHRVMESLKKRLKNIGYPENFGGERRTEFDIVMKSTANPALYKWHGVLDFLNRLNPFSSYRRKWRQWININCRTQRRVRHW